MADMREASCHVASPCKHAGNPFYAISHPLIVMLLAQCFYISKKGCIGLTQCIPALLESVLCTVGFMDKVIVASVQQRDTLTEIEEPVSSLCKIRGAAFYCHATLLRQSEIVAIPVILMDCTIDSMLLSKCNSFT